MKNRKNHLIVYSIGLVTILLDQLIKFIISKTMNIGEELEVIKGFFSILYIKNTGAAFSIFEDQIPFLIFISLICISLIIYLIQKEKYINKLKTYTLGILIGGMLANLIDRLFYEGVIDYLAFEIFNYHFPIFNFADIGITIGVASYIIISIIEEKYEIKGLCDIIGDKKGE